MPEIYKLRMLSDENDNFLREYEISGDDTLLDLHEFICEDLGYDSDEATSFFTSDAQWRKLAEFTPMDMGEEGPVPMQGVTLAEVLDAPHARLIYVFDLLNDRAMFLESGGSFESQDAAAYPRVSMSEADAPDQYEPAENEGSDSIFDEAMGEFGGFEGDESYEEEL